VSFDTPADFTGKADTPSSRSITLICWSQKPKIESLKWRNDRANLDGYRQTVRGTPLSIDQVQFVVDHWSNLSRSLSRPSLSRLGRRCAQVLVFSTTSGQSISVYFFACLISFVKLCVEFIRGLFDSG
jgi:hypothetical protein